MQESPAHCGQDHPEADGPGLYKNLVKCEVMSYYLPQPMQWTTTPGITLETPNQLSYAVWPLKIRAWLCPFPLKYLHWFQCKDQHSFFTGSTAPCVFLTSILLEPLIAHSVLIHPIFLSCTKPFYMLQIFPEGLPRTSLAPGSYMKWPSDSSSIDAV